MPSDQIKEAMTLISKLTHDQIQTAMASCTVQLSSPTVTDLFNSPAPSFGAQDIHGMREAWRPEQHAQLLKLGSAAFLQYRVRGARLDADSYISRDPTSYEQFREFGDGKAAWIGIPPRINIRTPEANAFQGEPFDKSEKAFEAVLIASKRISDSNKAADIAKGNVTAQTILRQAVTRKVMNSAALNAGVTATFELWQLFQDGDLKSYMQKVGVSALYGGSVSGLSACIDHPFFGNSAVVGIVVGSAFGVVSLASTGDWNRFGQNLGLNIASVFGSSVGSKVGANICLNIPFLSGPIGMVGGALFGGLVGAAGARKLASQTTGWDNMTEIEYETLYERIESQLKDMGLKPDPASSKRDFVDAFLRMGTDPKSRDLKVQPIASIAADIQALQESLVDWQGVDPTAFETFLEELRQFVATA